MAESGIFQGFLAITWPFLKSLQNGFLHTSILVSM